MADEPKATPIPSGMIARATSAVRSLLQSASQSAWFGAGQPLQPQAQDKTQGRRFDYPTYYNIDQRPRGYEPVGFEDLRQLAENCDVLRAVIETRKDQIEAMDWTIRVKAADDDTVKPKTTNDQKKVISQIKSFFEYPDKEHTFSQWIREILEDMFVIDAVAIYKRRDRGGRLWALELMDGATIKPIINDDGRTPTAPDPAYQQILKGLPTSNYTASTEAQNEAASFSKSELIYLVHNPRTHKVYGYSQVEQVLMTVNIFIRRTLFQLDYYRDGSQPDAFVSLPDGYNLEQVKAFQDNFDAMMAGNLRQRRRVRFMPGGFDYQEVKQPPMKDEYDEWLARIVCYVFSVSPTPFVKQVNRNTAQSQHDAALEEGLAPLLKRVKALINKIIREEFERDDIEFAWADDREQDPAVQATILTGYVGDGIITIDEAREKLGEEARGGAAGNLMVKTATGYVDIEIAQQTQQDTFDNPPPPPVIMAPGSNNANGGNNGTNPKNVPVQDKKGANQSKTAQKLPNGNKTPAKAENSTKDQGKGAKKAHFHDDGHDEPAYSRLGKRDGAKPVPFDRPATRAARASLKKIIKRAFDGFGKDLTNQVRQALAAEGVKKASDTDSKKKSLAVVKRLNLAQFNTLIPKVKTDLEDVAEDAANREIAVIGLVRNEDITDVVNERAVDFARDRAAEMVGKTYDDNGNIIDNPNADYVITDATRDSLQKTIADSLADGMGTNEIADLISENFAFSETRAEMIANTEVARANSAGALMGMKIAQEHGVEIEKEWYPDEDACPVCQANADQGAIPLSEDFDSGDPAPPAHPWCECVILSSKVTGNADDDSTDSADED